MTRNYLHLSDLHLDHLSDERLSGFMHELRSSTTEDSVVLISGDVTSAKHLREHIDALVASCNGRVLYVLGNHDLWGTSFAMPPQLLAHHVVAPAFFLDLVDHVSLDDETCVVGDSGWYDGRNGTQGNPTFVMRDWYAISEYLGRSDVRRLSQIIADARAATLDAKIRAACEKHDRIIVVTHIPPYVESCLYLGRPSDDYALPWFSSQVMGDTLDQIAAENPDKKFEILCGHTHDAANYRRSSNLNVRVAAARYGSPRVESWEPILW